MIEAPSQLEPCRHAGCPRPRVRLSVFCEEHHRRQLERAGTGAELAPKDMVRLAVGPLWLNAARGGAVAAAAVTLDRPSALVVIAVVTAASAVVGWRWSRRLVWQPKLGFPIAFIPSPWFAVPITLYCVSLAALVATLAIAALQGCAMTAASPLPGPPPPCGGPAPRRANVLV